MPRGSSGEKRVSVRSRPFLAATRVEIPGSHLPFTHTRARTRTHTLLRLLGIKKQHLGNHTARMPPPQDAHSLPDPSTFHKQSQHNAQPGTQLTMLAMLPSCSPQTGVVRGRELRQRPPTPPSGQGARCAKRAHPGCRRALGQPASLRPHPHARPACLSPGCQEGASRGPISRDRLSRRC